MKTGIHVEGASPDPVAVAAVTEAVIGIFKAAHDTRMDQETIRHALGIVEKMGSVNGTSISGSHFQSAPVVDLEPLVWALEAFLKRDKEEEAA